MQLSTLANEKKFGPFLTSILKLLIMRHEEEEIPAPLSAGQGDTTNIGSPFCPICPGAGATIKLALNSHKHCQSVAVLSL